MVFAVRLIQEKFRSRSNLQTAFEERCDLEGPVGKKTRPSLAALKGSSSDLTVSQKHAYVSGGQRGRL